MPSIALRVSGDNFTDRSHAVTIPLASKAILMLRWLRSIHFTKEQRANGLASFLAFGALGLLYLEAPPVPAGAGHSRVRQARSHAVVLAAPTTAMASVSTSREALKVPLPADDILSAAGNAAPAATDSPAISNLKEKVALLEQGKRFLLDCPDYTAVFSKQELVGNQLLDMQDIFLKCRHEPFSIYLLWLSGDEGREVLYVDGQNEGRMVVHGGGWKARLPALTISPDSSLAMQESRYPVTKAGLLGTVEMTLSVHADDLLHNRIARCERLEDQEFDGRMCATWVTEYKDAKISPTYRKSITLIDKEWNVPLYMRNFGWPQAGADSTGEALDEATVIEHYTFTEVAFHQQLATSDFDRGNAEYLFK